MDRTNLRKIIFDNDTKSGRVFVIFIQTLIILSLITFTIETVPDIDWEIQKILDITEYIIVIIFTIEYLLRILVSDKKLKYIFSFYGLIDLFAILPFYVARGIDLRSIRIFRILRLFRVFKVVRYSKATQRFRHAFSSIKEELILFIIATIFLIYISSVGIYYFENEAQPDKFKSVFECMWWSIATLTTVGYGDVYPITTGGKIFTSFIVVIGLGVVAIPAGLLASALTKSIKNVDIDKG